MAKIKFYAFYFIDHTQDSQHRSKTNKGIVYNAMSYATTKEHPQQR